MIRKFRQEWHALLRGKKRSTLSVLRDGCLLYIAMALNNFGLLYFATQCAMEAETACGESFYMYCQLAGPNRDRTGNRPQLLPGRLKTICRDADRQKQYG